MNKLSVDNFLLRKQNPTSKAIITSDQNYIYEDLLQKVLSAASYFKSKKILSKDRVGILGDNSVDYVINVLALWQIGAVPVPLNIRLNDSEITEQLTSSNCKTVLIQRQYSEKLQQEKFEKIIYPIDQAVAEFLKPEEKFSAEDPVVIIFTSGSTDKSKGIVLSFRSLYNSAVNGNHLLRYTFSDRWLASLPFYHIGGFSILTRSILFGIPIIIPETLSTENIIFALNNFQPTFISLVAAQLKKFVDTGITPNTEMKNCLLGGGFTDRNLLTKAYDLGWPINVVYGSSETASFVTALLKDEIFFKPNSVGRPLPTNRIVITDQDGNALKPFEIGEIAIETNSLMLYYVNKEETERAVRGSYYYTGDFGYVDEEGYLFIEGRKNYLVSTGGENVNPVEVEKVLLEHPSIQEAAVFPIKDEKWGEMIAAALVVKPKTQAPRFEEIKEFLEGKISAFKIPGKIFFEKELPKTELGKVLKDKLIERYKFTSL